VAYDDDRANVCDKIVNSLAADDPSITLADFNVRDKDGIPPTLKICPRGSGNDRIMVEAVFPSGRSFATPNVSSSVPSKPLKPAFLIWLP
jgi:hypothetical protein